MYNSLLVKWAYGGQCVWNRPAERHKKWIKSIKREFEEKEKTKRKKERTIIGVNDEFFKGIWLKAWRKG